jgi:hypothetical protein
MVGNGHDAESKDTYKYQVLVPVCTVHGTVLTTYNVLYEGLPLVQVRWGTSTYSDF